MAGTTTRDRLALHQVADVSRKWARAGVRTGSLALVDPGLPADDPLIAQLRRLGIEARLHHDVLAALVRLGSCEPDVVVLSAATSGPDLALLVAVIRTELSVPVLLAFGPDDLGTIGPAVAAGAVPSLPRPYGLRDVVEAIEPHWPRRPERGERLVVGDLVLDVEGYDAHLGRLGVDLTTVEFGVLSALARRADRVVAREPLGCQFWPRSPDPDGPLVATITRIRRKLAAAGAPAAIHTVRGVGYRLESSGLQVTTPSPRVGR